MADRTGVHTTSRGDAMQLHSGRPYYPLDPRPEDVDPDDVAVSLARVPRFNGHTTVRPYPVLEHLVRACDLSLFLDGWSPFETEHVPAPPPADGSQRIVNGKSTSCLTEWLNSAARPMRHPASLLRVVRRARLCLAHDAAEHAIADVTRPLKVNMPDYQRAEAPNDRACYTALAGAPPTSILCVPVNPTEYADAGPWVTPSLNPPAVALDEHAWVKHVDNLMLAAERAAVMRRESDGGLAWGDLPTPPACRATNLRSAYWSPRAAFVRSSIVFDADADAEIARARLEIERKRLRTDGETIGEAEMAYFAAVEEARAIRLRVAWRERLDLLRVFDEIEQSERARDVWHGAP